MLQLKELEKTLTVWFLGWDMEQKGIHSEGGGDAGPACSL